MRILMTVDTVGGVWTYALDLVDALAPDGVEVELATMGPPPDADQRAALARSAVAGLHESSFALEWEDEPWDDVDAAGRWLLELEERVDPDLVHLNGYAHSCLPWQRPAIVVAHSDVLSWWEAVRREPIPPDRERYRIAVEAGLRAADVVCAPTQAALDGLRRHYDFQTDAVVVHNGRSWPHEPRRKEPFVLGIGRFWDEAKNVTALERVRTRSPWPVVPVGAGGPLGRLPSSEVADRLARAAVFASPARYEPFGLAILEAALAGCALVLGDIASLRELWDEAAVFVDPLDDDALADALSTLARDEELRRELSQRALLRARRYTPEAMADRYASVYARVVTREVAAR